MVRALCYSHDCSNGDIHMIESQAWKLTLYIYIYLCGSSSQEEGQRFQIKNEDDDKEKIYFVHNVNLPTFLTRPEIFGSVFLFLSEFKR